MAIRGDRRTARPRRARRCAASSPSFDALARQMPPTACRTPSLPRSSSTRAATPRCGRTTKPGGAGPPRQPQGTRARDGRVRDPRRLPRARRAGDGRCEASGARKTRSDLMTLHSRQGPRIRPMVFLPGWEEGLFPSSARSTRTAAQGLEEERRLAYVGITRAKRRATISFAPNRQVYSLWQTRCPRASSTNCRKPMSTSSRCRRAMAASGSADYGESRFEDLAQPSNTYATPGWQRAQQRWSEGKASRATPQLIEGDWSPATTDAGFAKGERVFHQKFGYGASARWTATSSPSISTRPGEKRVIDSFVSRGYPIFQSHRTRTRYRYFPDTEAAFWSGLRSGRGICCTSDCAAIRSSEPCK